MMKRNLLFLLCLACMCLSTKNAHGQRPEILSDDIHTLQVVAGDRWQEMPVIGLGSSESVCISFDELSHTYRRFTYRVEHCEWDWSVSEDLLMSEYVEGFAEGLTIEEWNRSSGTTQLYSHYELRLPNKDCRVLLSGNYRVSIYDDNGSDEPVIRAYFMVCEGSVRTRMGIRTDTDKDINGRHQQVEMSIDFGGLRVQRPESQLHTVVLQNGRWDNARTDVAPRSVRGDGLEWNHCDEYVFDAGNEYRKYEILDVQHPTMGIDRIRWDGSSYHVYPWLCEPRRNYVYDEDANGAFYVRNAENIGNDLCSEYVYVHYALKCDGRLRGDVYVNGQWTNDWLTPEYRMTYNEAEDQYEITLLQKQGYYNYQFLLVSPEGKVSSLPTEGDFFETENCYQALVYYRELGGRTDRLVGFQQVCTK